MTPADAVRQAIDIIETKWLPERVNTLREALQIVEGVARVREALEAGARNLSGVSRAAYHYVLSTDGVAAWPAGIYSNPPRTEWDGHGITLEMAEVSRLLMGLNEAQRGLVLCWFCNGCRRYVGPGDSCTCERDE
jgi:hypothetical protein